MSHHKTLCQDCKKVISQCRCPSPDKEVRWGVCRKCAASRLQMVPTTADGGDVVIRGGLPGTGDPLRDIPPGNPGNVRFQTPGGEDVLVIRGDGSAFVRGTEVPDTDEGNRQLFQAFVAWLRDAYHVAAAPDA